MSLNIVQFFLLQCPKKGRRTERTKRDPSLCTFNENIVETC